MINHKSSMIKMLVCGDAKNGVTINAEILMTKRIALTAVSMAITGGGA